MSKIKIQPLVLVILALLTLNCSQSDTVTPIPESTNSENTTEEETADITRSEDETLEETSETPSLEGATADEESETPSSEDVTEEETSETTSSEDDSQNETPETSSSQDPNLHIYLCFGQSNMDGTGFIEAQDLEVNERFKTFQAVDCPNLNRVKETWYTAEAPLTRCLVRMSPADYFGRTMVTNVGADITIGIINVSVSGCDIRLFDKDQYQDHNNRSENEWYTAIMTAYDSNPYRHLIDLANLAQQEGVIKGILLHQGETNSGDTMWPNYVDKIYNDMLSDLSLSADEVPLLAGEMLSAEGNCCAESMNPIINSLPDVIPTAHIISSDGCTGKDYAHFNSEGYRVLGKRYADKMLSLQ